MDRPKRDPKNWADKSPTEKTGEVVGLIILASIGLSFALLIVAVTYRAVAFLI